jgi:formylmethanofuran dehydrogenase subunit E
MSMIFECAECGEWFRSEKDVYQEDDGECICVSCWEDINQEIVEKHYGRSSRSV